ncbi:DcaP family trimeric outer membrane transporter [Solilutibacter silvestris]|uniref:DcaP family trimeric outer membrane transporter n=1 Tax=Solilutibacter silvestris TaxID=1645665 RepID=UPI003D345C11
MKRPSLRTPLALAITLALTAANPALAATKKEKELEARVAQLEAQVKALVNAQQQQQAQLDTTKAEAADAHAQVADTKTELDKIKATQPAPLPAGKQPIQATAINTGANPGTTFSYGGFVKLDAMATKTSDGKIDDGSAGRIFYLPSQIPVSAPPANGGNAYTDISAQLSRFWLSADTVTQRGDKLKGYVEMDFYGGGSNALNGNETSTNTYGVTLRQAYVQWNNWLAGQTWSNFQDVAALPDAVDFVGPTDGTIFVRQAQIRYAKGNWSFSAENPQTTIGSVATGARLANSGANVMPDLTARYTTKGNWGHFSVALLARQFEYQNKLANGSYQSAKTATGGAVSVAGNFNIGKNDDLRYMVNAGSGISRYMAFGLGSDTVLDANGGLHALDGYGGFVSWRHAFSPKLRGNLMYSMAMFDNDRSLPGWGINSWGVTERARSIHANLIYSPIPKLDLGAEITYGKRDLEDNRSGDLKRVQATVKYSF